MVLPFNLQLLISYYRRICIAAIPVSSTLTGTTLTSSSSVTAPSIPVSSGVPAASGSSSDNASSKKSKSNAGAIAGGVVGGIAFLAIVGLVAFWLLTRRSLVASTNVDQNGLSPEKTDYFNSRPVANSRIVASPSSGTLYVRFPKHEC